MPVNIVFYKEFMNMRFMMSFGMTGAVAFALLLSACGKSGVVNNSVVVVSEDTSEAAAESSSGELLKPIKEDASAAEQSSTESLESSSDESVSEESAEPAADETADTPEEPVSEEDTADTVNFVGDLTMFDDEGVKITFDGMDGDRILYTVENNNEDNKQVHFERSSVSVNRLCTTGQSAYVLDGNGSSTLLSGESCTFYHEIVSLSTDYYNLGIEEMPVESVTLCLEFTIGTGSETKNVIKTFETDKYDEGEMASLFGEKVGSAPSDNYSGAYTFDFYYKEISEDVFAISIVNASDVMYYDTPNPMLTINGKEFIFTGAYHGSMGLCPDSAVPIRYEYSDDDIRKACEISGDAPIDFHYEDLNGAFYLDLMTR